MSATTYFLDSNQRIVLLDAGDTEGDSVSVPLNFDIQAPGMLDIGGGSGYSSVLSYIPQLDISLQKTWQ